MSAADPFTTSQAAPVACVYMPHFAAWSVSGETGERAAAQDRDGVIVHVRKRVYSASPAYLYQGLRPGTSLHQARLLFPRARFLRRDTTAEQIYADVLLSRFYRLAPRITSLDDRALSGWWVALQGFLPAELKTAVGGLLARGGCASVLPAAMLAAVYAHPGQLHTPSTWKAFLRTAPIQPLAELGIRLPTLEFLHWAGMKTLAHLHGLSRRHLQARFGGEGAQLFTLLHPSAPPMPVPRYAPRSVTVTRTISWPPLCIQDFHPHLEALLRSARTRIAASTPTWIRLILTQEGGARVEQFRPLKVPFQGMDSLDNLVLYLLTRGLEKVPDRRPLVRLALTLGGLVRAAPIQASLFPCAPDREATLENLCRRFPHQLLRPVHHTDTPFLPEEEFSLGPLAG